MSKSARRSPSTSRPVAESFETALQEYKEKEKDYHGEQRDVYKAVLARIEHNVHHLSDLRQQHTQLRGHLNELIVEKRDKAGEADAQSRIKSLSHEVALLQKQVDKLVHLKEETTNRRDEFQRQLAAYNAMSSDQNPDAQELVILKNKLDKAMIKNDETKHLIKLYTSVLRQYEQHKMSWNRDFEHQQELIRKKKQDIGELALISRDSEFSRNTTRTEFAQEVQTVNQNKEKRDRKLESQVKKAREIASHQNYIQNASNYQAQPSSSGIGPRPSIMRKNNKQLKEKKEEKLRHYTLLTEQIREAFGTNNPDKIQQMINERKQSTKTLNNQIDSLKVAIKQLQEKQSLLHMEIEEAEYTSAKGVGANRLLLEGNAILEEKKKRFYKSSREAEAFSDHQNAVKTGLNHYVELLAIGTPEGELIPPDLVEKIRWCRATVRKMQDALDHEEDIDFERITNRTALRAYIARSEMQFEVQKTDSEKKPNKRIIDPLRRLPKDQKGEVTTRVKDRETVKRMAAQAVAEIEASKKAKK